ncbi:hypothetical protein HPB52_018856 [Rhipicephalus sanguineus]|uniref:non-specific serine/threonine protein kinase n=1 Tax=Rhipicephalus sanguineus TaxID=34632 RepID=A0A9D4PZV4_RHISA|nr:hypothetical protein HPB52_018856 [Rhipicephalus sanguineus]
MKLLSAWRPLSSACAQQSRRCYSVTTNGEYCLRGYLSDAMVRFRVALRTLWPRGRVAVRRGQGPPVLSRYLQRWAKQTRAADLRRRAARQLFAGARLPLMGLTGVCLVTKPSLVTSEEELESVCVALRPKLDLQELAVTMSKKQEVAQVPDKEAVKLDDLELGTVLGKGANAVVYSGRWRTPVSTQKHPLATDDSNTASAPLATAAAKEEFSPAAAMKEENDGPRFDLAVKVLFNYYAASNAAAIWDSLQKECLPVLVNQLLPAGFVQDVDWRAPREGGVQLPLTARLSDASSDYQDEGSQVAAIRSLGAELEALGDLPFAAVLQDVQAPLIKTKAGLAPADSPLTYQQSGRQLQGLDGNCSSWWRCRLPPHAHIVEMPVAFVDSVSVLPGATVLWPSALSPRLHPRGCGRNATLYLVMRRYQCSLAEYLQSGVAASRDPQVRLSLLCQLLEAVCYLGQHSVAHRDLKVDNLLLDLSKAGTLAYELYGAPNPFYDLDSRTYAESDLPQPPAAMPPVVRALVLDMLRRDPKQVRMSALLSCLMH